LLCRQSDNNIVFAGQRINQNWIEYLEVANMIIVPMQCFKPSILSPYFKIKVGFFDNLYDYTVWKTEPVKLTANGERVRKETNKDIGINFVKLKFLYQWQWIMIVSIYNLLVTWKMLKLRVILNKIEII
jgi:hypothetical protein